MTDADLEKQLQAARRAGPSWNPGRQQRVNWAVWAGLGGQEAARRRRTRVGLGFWTLGLATLALGVVHHWRQTRPLPVLAPPPRTASAPPAGLSSTLADGSRVVLDGPGTVLRKSLEERDDVLFELDAGGAQFEVARRPSRVFRVHAGAVTVQVIGTGFRVQRQQSRCRVAVEHGRVLVSWWGGSRELGAGEAGVFPPESPTATAAATAPAPIAAPAPALRAAGGRARAEAASAPPGPDQLFARADQARAEGRPEAAIAHLREIVDRYPGDPHAAAAAFTVGRLLLESSRRPREAAAAFAQARTLAQGGPLAEDALAREVEALRAAGETGAARSRAQLYAALFPTGVRLQQVKRLGGLDSDR
jgi:TolA-binding protein